MSIWIIGYSLEFAAGGVRRPEVGGLLGADFIAAKIRLSGGLSLCDVHGVVHEEVFGPVENTTTLRRRRGDWVAAGQPWFIICFWFDDEAAMSDYIPVMNVMTAMSQRVMRRGCQIGYP